MPSSLIFAALAVAWLVVLVPMIAKRRQEVVRTADSALASRVLRRPEPSQPAEEGTRMSERTVHQQPRSGPELPEPSELEADERRYRPGRGGYDPEAAALAARARYAFRQRVVVGLILAAVATVVLALVLNSTYWWAHATFDAALIGYLGYLRRQVRIEEEIRRRRAARLSSRSRRPDHPAERSEPDPVQPPEGGEHEDELGLPDEPALADEPVRRAAPPPAVHPTAVAVDLDDEDPAFAELEPTFEPSYRRAAGE